MVPPLQVDVSCPAAERRPPQWQPWPSFRTGRGRLTGFLGSTLGTKKWNQSTIGHSGGAEVADLIGGPSRTRTLDPLIKSQLLCQLS
jgi:hypothetical protein